MTKQIETPHLKSALGTVAAGVAGLAVGAAAANYLHKHPDKAKSIMREIKKKGKAIAEKAEDRLENVTLKKALKKS